MGKMFHPMLLVSGESDDFERAFQSLLSKGKKTGELSHQEIGELLNACEDTGPEWIDSVLERFAQNGIEIVDEDAL